MNTIKITANDIRHNKTRTIGMAAIVAVIFCLLSILLTLREGMNGELSFVSASRIYTRSRLPQNPFLPLNYLNKLKTLPHIAAASYVVSTDGRTGNNDTPFQILFVPPAETLDVYPDISLDPEHTNLWESTRNAAVIGADLARKRRWNIGDTVPVVTGIPNASGNSVWEFKIAGIYATDLSPPYTEFFLANYEYYNEYMAVPELKSIVYQYLIRVDDPQQTGQVAATIDAAFATESPQTLTVSQRDDALAFIEQFADIATICLAVGMLAFLSLAFVLATSMRMVFEKKRKILATLHSLGFSRWTLAMLSISDGVLLVVPGFVIGIGIAAVLVALIGPSVRELLETFYMNTSVLLWSFSICILLLLVLSLPPVLHILRFRLTDELRR